MRFYPGFATALIAAALCSAPACGWLDRHSEPEKPSGVDAAEARKADKFSLQLEGAETLEFERRGDEFAIKSSGTKTWGTLKLDKDRVKLDQEGKETAKAKAKDYGFK